MLARPQGSPPAGLTRRADWRRLEQAPNGREMPAGATIDDPPGSPPGKRPCTNSALGNSTVRPADAHVNVPAWREAQDEAEAAARAILPFIQLRL